MKVFFPAIKNGVFGAGVLPPQILHESAWRWRLVAIKTKSIVVPIHDKLKTCICFAYMWIYIWETGKSVDEGVFICGAFLSSEWLRTTKSDMVNYQKRYLAISWNTIIVHLCLRWLETVPFFPRCRQSQSDTRSDTLAIHFWYINAHKFILSPHGFHLVEFQLWTRKKRSPDVRHTWPALSKNP